MRAIFVIEILSAPSNTHIFKKIVEQLNVLSIKWMSEDAYNHQIWNSMTCNNNDGRMICSNDAKNDT